MKRIRITGLCLVAVFALGAMVAAAAQATVQPEFKVGVCVAQKKGNFTESGCKTVAEKTKKGISEPDHKGTYELAGAPCVAQKKGNYLTSACNTEKEKKGIVEEHKGKYERTSCYPYSCGSFPYQFTGASGTSTITAHSTTGALETVVCTKDTGVGEVTSASGSKEKITFEGCKNAGGEPCTSFTYTLYGKEVTPTAAPEAMQTEKLSPELYWLEPGEKDPGIALVSNGPTFVNIYCGSEPISTYDKVEGLGEAEATGGVVYLKGAALGTVVNTVTGETITFAVKSGDQEQQTLWYEGEGYRERLFTEPGEVEATLASVEQQTGAGVS